MLTILLVVAAILVLMIVGWGALLLLIQLGVIVKESSKPVHTDTSNYSLQQGREVGREDR